MSIEAIGDGKFKNNNVDIILIFNRRYKPVAPVTAAAVCGSTNGRKTGSFDIRQSAVLNDNFVYNNLLYEC